MKELIDKTEVINRLLKVSEKMAEDTTDQFWLGVSQGLQDAVSIIKAEFKPIDPVKHGRCINGDCSECGLPIPTDDRISYIAEADVYYCYNCGAKMDGGSK